MRKTIIFLSLLFQYTGGHSQTITTYAGTGTIGYNGDGILATAAQLNWPTNLCADKAGNIYICDNENFRIRKVSSSGIISTFAGCGTGGHSGDGGPATTASIRSLLDVCADKSGSIYFSEATYIRKVNTSGIISTVAGTGIVGFSGDGGPATAAKIRNATHISADTNGNVYFTDAGNNRVRKISTTGIITTVAGTGSAGYSGDGVPATNASINPIAICFDKDNNMYIADGTISRIRKISPSGILSTVAGDGSAGVSGDGGPASGASLGCIHDIAFDNAGNMLLADGCYSRIRLIDHITGIITTIAGSDTACGYSGDGGPATAAKICEPWGIAIDKSGSIYFLEYHNYRVRRIRNTVSIKNIIPKNVVGYLSIMPNPSHDGVFTVNAASLFNELVAITITNTTGQVVYTATAITNSKTDIQLNTPPGIYFASAASAHGTWTGKIVIGR